MIRSKVFFCLLIIFSFLSSCISVELIPYEPNITPFEWKFGPNILKASATVSPTYTDTPTKKPIPTATLTPTRTQRATRTKSPSPTRTATPTFTGDQYLEDIIKGNIFITPYEIVLNTVATDSNGESFEIFGLESIDKSIMFAYPEFTFHLLVYHLNNGTKELIGEFYVPERSHWETIIGDMSPTHISLIDWDNVSFWGFLPGGLDPRLEYFYKEIDEIKKPLSLSIYFSDINQNGFPEFTIRWEYLLANGPLYSLHYYEIRDKKAGWQTESLLSSDTNNDYSVVDLNASFPGVLIPGYTVHSIDPLSLNVIDIPFGGFINFKVYEWDGTAYRDVSTSNANDYISYAETYADSLRGNYGNPFYSDFPVDSDGTNLYSILFLYERVGLAGEGLDLFLELSDPKHWPGTHIRPLCWLQLARAEAREDFLQRNPFSFLDVYIYEPLDSLIDYYKNHPNTNVLQKYNLSACEELLQE
ncbi:hypothetical protein ACFLZW_03285 [Chloroflexota bacterium]